MNYDYLMECERIENRRKALIPLDKVVAIEELTTGKAKIVDTCNYTYLAMLDYNELKDVLTKIKYKLI